MSWIIHPDVIEELGGTEFQHRLLLAAIEKWGADAQQWQAVEELGELLVSLAHGRRGRVSAADIQEEIADVLIMCRQLAHIYGAIEVTWVIREKAQRLNERLIAPSKEAVTHGQ